MTGDEVEHLGPEGEGADAKGIERDPVGAQHLEGLLHRGRGGPEVDDADQGVVLGGRGLGRRHEPGRGLELARDPFHAAKVDVAVLAVAGVLVVRGAAHQVGPPVRVGRGDRAPRDPVAVHVEVPPPVLHPLEPLRVELLAPVVAARVVPAEGVGGPVVHPEVEVAHHDDGGLDTLGEVERGRRELERLGRVLREEEHVLGVAVRCVCAREDVRLLGAGRHAGRGAAALDVEQHHRDLGEVGEPEELRHERDPRAARRGEAARAVPACADRHADGGQLVLRLDHREVLDPRLGVHPQPLAVAREGVDEGGRRGDGVPGSHRRPRVDAAEGGRGVAVDEDPVAGRLAPAHPDPERAVEVLAHPGAPELQGLHVGGDEAVLAAELVGDEPGHRLEVHVEEGGEGADVDDVLEELPLARILVVREADLGEGNADPVDVGAVSSLIEGLGGVVEEIPSGEEGVDVLAEGRGVHRDHDVDPAAPPEAPRLAHPHLVPGGEPLDVRGKDVAGADRDPHPEHRLREQVVRARRARAVDVGELDDEVVDGADLRHVRQPWKS